MTPLMTGSVLLRRVATLAALMLGALTLVGCTGAEPAETGLLDPLSEAVNPDASNNERVRAILAARAEREAGEIERERYREVLKSIAWKRSNFAPVRIAAIEALAADGPDDTARMLALLLPTEPSWDVIEASGELAAEQGWNITTSGLVRSWSREVQEPRDADRPERAALLALHPDRTDVEIVYNVFARPDVPDTFRQRTRREAWALLTRLDEDGERIRELLTREDRSDDPLIVTLRRGARELAVVPRTPTSLQRLERLYEKHEDFRQRAASVVASLNDAQRRGLELRHLAPLLWTERHEPAWLDADSAELISLLEARLDGRDTFRRTSGWSDRMSAPDETVQEWREDLVWADLLTILIADGAVRDPAVIEAVFRFQVQDRRDRSTELGGLIDAVGDDPASSASPRFVATLYEPRPTQRSGDQAFIAPVEMLSDAATALLCFHMQVQSVNNVEFAGPSQGDIAFARAHALSCVVFTSISGSAMNVDYYQGDGARIDLGAVRR